MGKVTLTSCALYVGLFNYLLGAETREDRTKRLFRHYTVGSYDNYTSYRYLFPSLSLSLPLSYPSLPLYVCFLFL